MTITTALYTCRTDEWSTPSDFFAALDAEFAFTLDPCASPENAKCAAFFTKEQDGLAQDWGRYRVFCNPPYGSMMRAWARKCCEASRHGALVVLLAHVRTDTRWFHDWVYGKAAEIRLIKGRLKFGDGRHSAPFPSLVAIFRPPRAIHRRQRRTAPPLLQYGHGHVDGISTHAAAALPARP